MGRAIFNDTLGLIGASGKTMRGLQAVLSDGTVVELPGFYFRRDRHGVPNVICKMPISTYAGSPAQIANQTRFTRAAQQVGAIMRDEQRRAFWQRMFDEYVRKNSITKIREKGKICTLRGFIFNQLFQIS